MNEYYAILYTKPHCTQCESTKTLMKKLGILYQEVDLSRDSGAFEKVKEMGFKQAPVIVTPIGAWSGYQPEMIEQYNSILNAPTGETD